MSQDLTAPGQEAGGIQKRGELIAVCSAKGGIGRTITAINLAVALSKKNIKVCIIDGSFQFGDVALALDLQSTFTIRDVMENAEQLDRHTLAGFLIQHGSGIKVLAAPERPEYADLISAELLDRVMDMLLVQFDYVIVDTEAGLKERTLQFIEKADRVLMLTTLEMAAIKNGKMMLDTLTVLGFRDKTQTVINRSTMESVIKATDVPDILGEELPLYVPNEFTIVSQSLNVGVPFVTGQGKSEVAKAMFRMAEQLVSNRQITLFKPKSANVLQQLFRKTSKLMSL